MSGAMKGGALCDQFLLVLLLVSCFFFFLINWIRLFLKSLILMSHTTHVTYN